MKKFYVLALCLLLCLCGCGSTEKEAKNTATPKPTADDVLGGNTATATKEVVKPDQPQFTLFGHSSVKIITKEGKVIYIDPAHHADYGEAADYILVTHEHGDHCDTSLVPTKDDTKEFHYSDFLADGKYKSMDLEGVKVTAVPAYNQNHNKNECVGYVLEFDGIKLYHAGDTSYIKEMKDLTKFHLNYALLPIDGQYNMDSKEAMKCAKIIGAKHNIPIHTSSVNDDMDMKVVNKFKPAGRLVVKYGETISLTNK